MNRLKELRKARKMSQEQVGEIIGITGVGYGCYELGKRQMDYKTLISLADFFDVSIDYLIGRNQNFINNSDLTNDEREILDNYNYLTPADRQYIRGLIAGMARQNKKGSHRDVTATMIAG